MSAPRLSHVPSPPTDDTAWLAGFQRGDVAAYEAVFRTYYVPLCAFAAGFTQSWDAAEEIVQGMFATLWQRRTELRITGSVRAYLYAAVRNESLNVQRRAQVLQRTRDIATRENVYPGHSVPLAPPDIAIVQHEEAVCVQAAIAALPRRARELLTLRWEHGMSYDEIGDVMRILPRSAKMLHSRAMAQLRMALHDWDDRR